MPRERDVRTAIRDALLATSAFSDVWLSGLPEDYGQGASDLTAAAIEPQSTSLTAGWDAGLAGGLEWTCQLLVTLLARGEDPQLRDELAEQLLDFLHNAVDGQHLGSLTVPDLTRVTAWRWLPPTAPERRIAATVAFSYIIENWEAWDVTA